MVVGNEKRSIMARIKTTTELADLAEAFIVVEAVKERHTLIKEFLGVRVLGADGEIGLTHALD